jgi:hypothetical protein
MISTNSEATEDLTQLKALIEHRDNEISKNTFRNKII